MRTVSELIKQLENEETVRFNIIFNPRKRKEYEFLCAAFDYMKCTGESFKEAVIYLAAASEKHININNESSVSANRENGNRKASDKGISSGNAKKSKKNNTILEDKGDMIEENIHNSTSEDNGVLADTGPSSDEKKRILKEKLAKTYS